MLFSISRTSARGRSSPLDGAQHGEFIRVHTGDSRIKRGEGRWREYNQVFRPGESSDEWIAEHRAKLAQYGDVQVYRMDMWFIEIADLVALMSLYEREGDLILRSFLFDEKTPEIEIYDDYRD